MFTKIFSQKSVLFLVGVLIGAPLLTFASPIIQINEFSPLPTSGLSWIELRSNDTSPLDLTGWFITSYISSTTLATTTLGSITIPPGGIISLDLVLDPDNNALFLFDSSEQRIDAVTYGSTSISGVSRLSTPPASGQSAYSLGGPWMSTSSPSRGWFNVNPTQASILTGLPSGVTTNLLVNTDWTGVTGLYFDRSGVGKIAWPGTFNLTGSSDVSALQNLSTGLILDKGYIKLDASSPSALADNSVEVIMSGLPFTYTQDDLAVSDPTAIISGFAFSTTSDGGVITFTSSKLATFSVATTAPVVELVVTPTSPRRGGGGSSFVPVVEPLSGQIATSTGQVLGTSTFRFPRYLSQGMRGVDVQELQKRLKLEGFFLSETTRYFGPLTKKAVIAYQKAHQIKPVTGVAAKATLAKLNFSASSILTVR